MSQSHKKQQDYEEPKSIIVSSYTKRVDKIEDLIDLRRADDALHAMCTFANRLNIPPNETDVLKAVDELNKNDERSFLPSAAVQKYWRLINKWLNENPFADLTRAKPKSTNTPRMGDE